MLSSDNQFFRENILSFQRWPVWPVRMTFDQYPWIETSWQFSPSPHKSTDLYWRRLFSNMAISWSCPNLKTGFISLKEARVDTRWRSFFFLFHGIIFSPDPCFYFAKGADWKGQVRKNLLCHGHDHIMYLSYIGMFLHITLLGLAYKVEGVIS